MCNCKDNMNGLCCHETQTKKDLLGLVASRRRDILPGTEFDKYFPVADGVDKIVIQDGTVRDTVAKMDALVKEYSWQTEKIAKLLQRKTLPETLDAIWTFLYKHIQYKLDKDHVEELRVPARSWHDRTTGIDCDCFSIFVGCILENLKINFKFRITKYSAGWQHVYVIVPVPDSAKKEYWVLDCVLDRFNYEKRYTDKFDHTMETLGIPVAVLSGDQFDELHSILTGADFDNPGFGSDEDADAYLGSLHKHLVRTRNYIKKNPQALLLDHTPAKLHLKRFDYALKHWHGGPNGAGKSQDWIAAHRHQALSEMADAEHAHNIKMGLCGADEDLDDLDDLSGAEDDQADKLADGGLGSLGKTKAKGRFWNAVKTAHKKVVGEHKNIFKKIDTFNKKLVKDASKGAKNLFKKIDKFNRDAAKKVGNFAVKFAKAAVLRYNPLVALARGGLLIVMENNWWNIAYGIYPGYLTESEAIAKGYTSDQWKKAQQALPKVKKIFVDMLQGKEANLKKVIEKGFKKPPHVDKHIKLKGVDDDATLGEPYSTGAAVTAAAGAIAAIVAMLTKLGIGVKRTPAKTNDGGGSDQSNDTSASNDNSNSDNSSDNSEPVKDFFVAQKQKAIEASSDDSQTDNSGSDNTDNSSQDDSNTDDSTNGIGDVSATMTKIKAWVKENPIKTTFGVLAGAALITLAVSPSARQFVGIGKKKKHGLSGHKKRRSRKKHRAQKQITSRKHTKAYTHKTLK